MRNSKNGNAQIRFQGFCDAAKAAGVKLTHQRLEIFKELAGTDMHPDAETVFSAVKKRMPTVSLDTVYRTLWTLHGLNLVATLGPRRDGVRFDTNMGPHHHYVCTRCELVRDFESSQLDRVRLPAELKQFGNVGHVQVEVRGVCIECKENEARKPKGKTKYDSFKRQ